MSVFVRDAAVGDVLAIAAIYAPFVLGSTVTLELEPPDDTEMERRRAAVQGAGLQPSAAPSPYHLAAPEIGRAHV